MTAATQESLSGHLNSSPYRESSSWKWQLLTPDTSWTACMKSAIQKAAYEDCELLPM
ncbi:Hypothetical predicted protein [Xyrichtys novacula]|uniref:Uncharacterized protein n=1 Tax=Xyrichtys novacula TaxID=13765 RepID=A0AAV1HDH6_XYRNO|nr:Hypothetical predicted protein [Xyrichtys novacula]